RDPLVTGVQTCALPILGGPLAKLSSKLRNAPLLDLMNPSEKPRQVVLPDILTDVSFMKIDTIDRCATCHVHIDKKEFSEENILEDRKSTRLNSSHEWIS